MQTFNYFYKQKKDKNTYIYIYEKTMMNWFLLMLMLVALFSCLINYTVIAIVFTLLDMTLLVSKYLVLSNEIKKNPAWKLISVDGSKYSFKESKSYLFAKGTYYD